MAKPVQEQSKTLKSPANRQERVNREPAQRECRHFLWLSVRVGKDSLNLWARCAHCSRAWLIGSHAEVMAGLSCLTLFEGEAS